jgi:hypothetical protein
MNLSAINEIMWCSTRLAKLLGSEVRRNDFARYYRGDFEEKDAPSPSELIAGLALLQEPAKKLRDELKRKSGRKSPKGFSSLDRLIFKFADRYEEFTGKRATVTVSVEQRIGGAFVRFAREAAHHLGVKVPSGSTIQKALKKRQSPQAIRNVIRPAE